MSEGIRIKVPDAVASGDVWGPEIELPSGTKVQFRRGTGKDVRLALTAVGQPFDSTRYLYAMIARTSRFDGKQITMEAVDDLDAEDVERLLEEARKPSPSPKAPAES
ncbi:MAG TPA: hypothetical protein VMA37_04755 [Acetobacteraceae bacterium]|nr:hypothetical protein [Acetobacteraceae bacterium]